MIRENIEKLINKTRILLGMNVPIDQIIEALSLSNQCESAADARLIVIAAQIMNSD